MATKKADPKEFTGEVFDAPPVQEFTGKVLAEPPAASPQGGPAPDTRTLGVESGDISPATKAPGEAGLGFVPSPSGLNIPTPIGPVPFPSLSRAPVTTPTPFKGKVIPSSTEGLSNKEIGDSNVIEILLQRDVQGVSDMERFGVRNVVRNIDDATTTLNAVGYHTYPLSDGLLGFNLATQLAKIDPETGELMGPDMNAPWQVLDPGGFKNKEELGRDFLDLMFDAMQGGIIEAGRAAGGVLGAPGGPITAVEGQAIGAAAGGFLTELGRQKLAQMIGVDADIDTAQAGTVALFSGALPLVGPALNAAAGQPILRGAKFLGRSAARGISRGVGQSKLVQNVKTRGPQAIRQLQAALVGIGSKRFLRGQEMLRIGANALKEKFRVNTKMASDAFRTLGTELKKGPWPQQIAKRKLLKRAGDLKVNLRQWFNSLDDFDPSDYVDPVQKSTFERLRTITSQAVTPFMKKVRERVQDPVEKAARGAGFAGDLLPEIRQTFTKVVTKDRTSPIPVPIREADKIVQEFGDFIRDKLGGFDNIKMKNTRGIPRSVRELDGELRGILHDAMGGRTGAFAKMNDTIKRRLDAIDTWENTFGQFVKTLDDTGEVDIGRLATGMKKIAPGEAAVRGSFNSGEMLAAMDTIDSEFGLTTMRNFMSVIPKEAQKLMLRSRGRIEPGVRSFAREAAVSETTAAGGFPGQGFLAADPITTVGSVKGASLGRALIGPTGTAGGLLGFAGGGPLGAIGGATAGLGLGLAMASPKVNLMVTRQLQSAAGRKVIKDWGGRVARRSERIVTVAARKAQQAFSPLRAPLAAQIAIGTGINKEVLEQMFGVTPNKGVARQDAKRRDIAEGNFQR